MTLLYIHMDSLPEQFIKVCNKLRKYIIPHKTNLKKIRIGNESDGGYVVCEGLPEYDALYSYGSDDQITFEKEFYKIYGKDSYVYDHTVDAITDKPDYLHFFKEGVSYQKTHDMDTIDNHIVKNDHIDCKNLFAQIDIEGSEWHILNSNFRMINNFSQVVIEFHLPIDFVQIVNMETIFDYVFTFMNERFICTHIHANNSPVQPWLDTNFPRIFEVTYVRKDLVTNVEVEDKPYPIEGLDFTCAPGRADLKLDYWIKK